MRATAALGVLTVFLAACGGGAEGARPRALTGPYAYDREAPLQLQREQAASGQGGSVHDLSYASPEGGRVTAYLILPKGAGKHPAVLLMHGSDGDRRELLGLAATLAARGIAALTIDSPVARTGAQTLPAGLEGVRRRRALLEQEVLDLRRAVDVLRAEPAVDPARLGFLGFSAGARSGAILAGVEPRIGSFVLISGGADPVSAYVRGASPQLRDELLPELLPVDPLRWIGKARPNTILFQAGRKDEVVPRKALLALIRAAPKPQRVRWYDSGHSPNGRVQADAIAWLAERLSAK
ncbi:MAG: acetylxylan esterase [Actinomycetota bacterium]|nr:acetylxylan esterase [Actinomycetota bacterium]